jgi:hypothetical protein
MAGGSRALSEGHGTGPANSLARLPVWPSCDRPAPLSAIVDYRQMLIEMGLGVLPSPTQGAFAVAKFSMTRSFSGSPSSNRLGSRSIDRPATVRFRITDEPFQRPNGQDKPG